MSAQSKGDPLATTTPDSPLSNWSAAGLIAVAALGYGFAFGTTWGAAAILVALPCILPLAKARSPRQAFYTGLVAGLAIYVPHLLFFWSIFKFAAIALWLVAGWPIAAFVLLLYLTRKKWGAVYAAWLTPILWTGIEYFRSECYYLKFAWLLPGQAAAFLPGVRFEKLGIYGLGFLFVAAATMVVCGSKKVRFSGVAFSLLLAAMMYLPAPVRSTEQISLHVAGVQLEEADEQRVAIALDRLAVAHPEAQILVLSEYSFLGPVPQSVRDVVRKHRRYLIAGGMKLLPGDKFFDTAFVIGPDGRDIFEQAKSVPVQLMDDGLPAPDRRVWNSPWGKIGIGVCYDISYARVMDDFVRQGAQGIIVPTMDPVKWGEYERRMLHGRLAPVRAAEYGIPVFGVWSSGVSQLVDCHGQIIATAGYPGQGQMIAGPFDLHDSGSIPPDRLLAIGSMAATALLIVFLAYQKLASRFIEVRGDPAR